MAAEVTLDRELRERLRAASADPADPASGHALEASLLRVGARDELRRRYHAKYFPRLAVVNLDPHDYGPPLPCLLCERELHLASTREQILLALESHRCVVLLRGNEDMILDLLIAHPAFHLADEPRPQHLIYGYLATPARRPPRRCWRARTAGEHRAFRDLHRRQRRNTSSARSQLEASGSTAEPGAQVRVAWRCPRKTRRTFTLARGLPSTRWVQSA